MSEEEKRRPVVRWRFVFFLLVILIGFLALVFLPARLSPPRSLARRANCLGNLKQIGLCFAMYADMNGGRLPMDGNPPTLLGSMKLLTNVTSSAKIFHCPEDTQHVPVEKVHDLTETSISYCYVAGLRWYEGVPKVVMFDSMGDGRNSPRAGGHQGYWGVLFTDGHVSFTNAPPVLDARAVLLCPP